MSDETTNQADGPIANAGQPAPDFTINRAQFDQRMGLGGASPQAIAVDHLTENLNNVMAELAEFSIGDETIEQTAQRLQEGGRRANERGWLASQKTIAAAGTLVAEQSNPAEQMQREDRDGHDGRSGNKHWVHWRWQCPTFLRQTFVEWAAQTINKSYWAGLYYRQQRDKGCNHQAAVRALAFKWIRILYRCWQTHTPYNEALYLKALKRRGSPLLNQIEATIVT